jgi:phenylpropionate dioxygenase-like ring-hydroxylating dioxygenase large terminal subunit
MLGFEEAAVESPVDRFFHPVYEAAKLRDKPVRVQIAGTPYVLFREAAGQPGALLDRCPHRFAPLSQGWVRNGRLTCPYHGWNFDRAGCGKSPSQPRLMHCDVAALQVVERYGYLWVAGANVPQEMAPDFAWDRFHFTGGMSIHFPAPLHVTLDNFGENEHTPFVHHRLGWNECDVDTLEFEGENHEDHTVSKYHARQRNTLIGTLVGLHPNDYIHNEYEIRFNPVRLQHHIFWTDPSRKETRGFHLRAVIYHVPETERSTWVHVFVWIRVHDRPPLGGVLVPVVRQVLMRMVRREIVDDAEFIPALADVPFSTKGMRLGKYDTTLVQNHRLLESIYWGRGPARRHEAGNGDGRQWQSDESHEAEALVSADA